MDDDQDDIYILELAVDDFVKDQILKNKISGRERSLRSQTIDTLVSRELNAGKELTGFAKIRTQINDYAINAAVAASTTGVIGYLHDESVVEYAVKGGLVAVTSTAVLYGLGKVLKYFKPSPEKTDEEKREEKVKEYEQLLSSQETYRKSKHKAALVGAAVSLITIIGSVLVAAPYTILASLYGIGAGTGLAAGTANMGVTGGRELYSRKQKLEQYDLERARIVGAELFK